MSSSGSPPALGLYVLFLLCIPLSFYHVQAAPISGRAPSVAIDGTQLGPLSATSRWIVDGNNQRVKLRCANWAGHLETNIPEGLQHRAVGDIAAFVASYGFNCVRLTYSIDGALNPSLSVQQSFANAATETGADLNAVYQSALTPNPWLSGASIGDVFDRVVDELGSRGIRVVLDNQMSQAGWCCGTTDGNGWWASAASYDASNSRFFDTDQWLAGLKAMAGGLAARHPGVVVAMDLRNEPRAVGSQDGNGHADWYNLTSLAAAGIHAANADLLISFGGPAYETDLSFIGGRPLDTGAWGGAAKTMYEAHIYSWSSGGLTDSDCGTLTKYAGDQWGYLLAQGKPYTGPLWVSEFGVAQTGGDRSGLADSDWNYLNCLVQYLESNDADWAYWALQGDYYVRNNATNFDESFGILDTNWQGARNPQFHDLLGKMWNITQTP